MSYQVLARKWRPRNFAEMVGQEHVLKALINALDHDRLHHAFLFTGTRGVGKTTIARILAKSLNCEKGVSSHPCGECSACIEIDAGRFVDLIEVDAASRTGVDDTRELTDNVQYAPTRGRYKVYLIDEVHMLSKNAFNALLKTLEEPPPHVKFLLATTDPQKIPITVLSRCLQFNLKRLPVSLIQAHLKHILEAEKIAQEPAAVVLIAHAADGSMRDALSLLDQAIAYGGGALREDDVRSMLGSIEKKHVRNLIDALASGDGNSVLGIVAQMDEQAPDYEMVLDELATLLQRM
ncbi:MAG TPA: DNA polymerase III subunit gamma/tau, partial [Gammaproteobacteria bacterium]|nr:DNA polymerase III subunit gamma/tau [Gammaproteobacteria bacterium]